MKYLKILTVAAVAAAALMAFAGSASATTLTVTTGNGTTDTVTLGTASLESELEAGTKATLKSSFIGEVICEKSTVAGSVTNAGGAEATVSGTLSTLTFSSCNGTVTVLKKGTLELHTEKASANGNGTLTSNGAEVTVELSGLHCIYSTSNTDVGELTGTHTGHVILHAESTPIPRTGGRSGAFCGSSAEWKATYTVLGLIWNGSLYTNFTVD